MDENIVLASVIFVDKDENQLLSMHLPYAPNIKEDDVIDLTVDVVYPDQWNSDINKFSGKYKVISIKQFFSIVYVSHVHEHHDIEVLVEKVEEVIKLH